MTPAPSLTTEDAYDELADVYDLLTAGYGHDRWLAAIEALALEHGLAGRRVLDVACGTGHSFLPLLDRGYAVTGCDVSEGMLARAALRAGGRAELHRADMRELPTLGRFDLITCLDDAVNHLLTSGELVAALAGMRANLAPGGLLVFDANTPAAYAAGGDVAAADDDRLVVFWTSRMGAVEPGGATEVVVDRFLRADGDHWTRTTSTCRHRHHPRAQIEACLEEAGLELVTVRGQQRGAVLMADADERRDPKLVFVARLA